MTQSAGDAAAPFRVEVIETSTLGDRSYLATDGRSAVVIDPQRDIDRILALAGRLGVRITHVAETHVHNDYVSGGLALAGVTGARYLVAAADDVAFARDPVRDGHVVTVSPRLRLRVVATPGHTFHHLSYVAYGEGRTPLGAFTGGSLLYGSTGRTDLLGERHAAPLARRQHASARRLADLLPDGAHLWPTHGFGSFCTADASDVDSSTVGREKRVNPVLRLSREEFVHAALTGLDAYPAYYAHMGAINAAGPAPLDLTPPRRADPAEIARRLDAGEWVVDLRSRTAFAARHLFGTISLGLDGAMATWLGWLAPFGTPVTLLAETAEQIAEGQRELARIGIDRPAAAATGGPGRWSAPGRGRLPTIETATFADLATARTGRAPRGLPKPEVVLDVRSDTEWRGGHLPGAVHIPLPELRDRQAEVPAGTVWVHCGSGYRAAAAASLLTRDGHRAVIVDDDVEAAEAAGLPMVVDPADSGKALLRSGARFGDASPKA